MARKHKLEEVLRTLSIKNDCKIKGLTIEILTNKIYSKNGITDNPKKKNDLGNGSWGKIDFLTNYCGFSISKVSDFSR